MLQDGADLLDGIGAIFSEMAKGPVPDQTRGIRVGGVNGGDGGDIVLVGEDVRAIVGAELAPEVDGGALDREMIHAFVRGVEVMAALRFALAKNLADAVFEQGGGGEGSTIGEADFAVGLSNAADRTELQSREAAEGSGTANEECGEERDEQQRGDDQDARGDQAPVFLEHCGWGSFHGNRTFGADCRGVNWN